MMRSLGLLVALLAGGAGCTTDQPKAPAALDAGAAPPVIIADAGSPPDAGALAATGTATSVDDAGIADHAASASSSLGPVEVRPAQPRATDGKSTVFDRLLVKPKERGADPAELKALIERRTGLAVKLARRTAGSWVMIQLVAAPGGRDEQDQRGAIEALKELGVFEVVEGDRLMKVKMP